jgi:glycosyltransferase involved in cell wall biosynthesis
VVVRWIEPDTEIGAHRGDTVVCIPVYGGHEHFASCLRSVLTHTPDHARVLVCDDASPDSGPREVVRELELDEPSAHEVFYFRRPLNVGFPANVNGAFAATAPADVVILNSDCMVAEGWLGGLREAAYSDSRVATATALTNHGSVVSVPERTPTAELPDGWSLDRAAAAIRSSSLRIRPRLQSAVGHCMFVRRSALELVGDFDVSFSPGYGEEVDFSQRCLYAGLTHVLADEVFVLHHGGGSFARDGRFSGVAAEHERILASRYPYFHDSIRIERDDISGPLARALSRARRALKGLSVIVDGRVLAGPTTGTQIHVLELIAGLARASEGHLAVLVPDKLSVDAARALGTLPDVKLCTRAQAASMARADVVHRPYQVNSYDDLSFFASLGERLVVTNQDLISYQNPAYFRDGEAWQGYRRVTRSALAAADRVVFFSAHARDDALAEDLLEPDRASVVHIGVDHTVTGRLEDAVRPAAAATVPDDAETILCIGTDFRHKNRLFAIRVAEQLQLRHDWQGYLLLAGPQVERGSSIEDEQRLLASSPRLADAVRDVGVVTEAEKAWLYARSTVVLYPTVYEGFGLVPFEAADQGNPCMWATGTSLSEVLPDEAGKIVSWDPAETADRALELMRDVTARERNLSAIRMAAAGLTWDRAAARLIEVYGAACDAPASPAGAVERRYGLMAGTFSEDAIRLVGPGGALPSEVERPLLALATHPQIGAPLFGAIKLGYRASSRLRRLRRD